MVTMSRFGNYGRLGNMLFQWAFLSSLARKKGVECVLPNSNIFAFFKTFPKTGNITGKLIKEPHYRFDPLPYENLNYNENLDFLGYWQNEKYFDEKVKEEINFKDSYKEKVKLKFESCFTRPTIAIGIRRTDYTETGVYHVISPLYYISALQEHFPDWRDCNLIFISDDLPYCKLHFGMLKNAFFPETKDIEQMCLMSLCDNFIIANSTFHWWAAFMADRGKVIQPTKLFTGSLLAQYGDINFYSDRWIKHEPKKIDLSDVTFTIPVMYDHQDRRFNVDLCITLLTQDFDTNIIIGEQGTDHFGYTSNWCTYKKYDYPNFHRTKMLNQMAKNATKFIANWDCDVAVPPMQLLESVYKLRQGAEMVYPYDGIFHRIRKKENNKIFPNYDLGNYCNDEPNGTESVGGAVMWNRHKFFEIGGENEYMISYAPEDVERHERAKKLGVRIERTKGNLYHFEHWCGPDSSSANPFFKKNKEFLTKERLMDKDQLIDYINTWPWHSPYTDSYYETIVDDAIRSRDAVFEILGIDKETTIVDCGCGVGAWGVGYPNYTGIDFRVPKDKILIEKYIEHDLRTPVIEKFPTKEVETSAGIFKGYYNYDLVMCLEVAEHIDEHYADILIDNLCQLGDTILFSAAIPYQGGNNHVNEKWQTYWAEKFKERGYGGYQPFKIREDKRVCMWYRQNMVVYKKNATYSVTDYVLPEYYEEKMKHYKTFL